QVANTANAFGAMNDLGHPAAGAGVAPGGPPTAIAPAFQPGPAPGIAGRDNSRRIAVIMVLVALVVSIAWFSRQGQPSRSALELGKSSGGVSVDRAPSSADGAARPSTFAPPPAPSHGPVPPRWASAAAASPPVPP